MWGLNVSEMYRLWDITVFGFQYVYRSCHTSITLVGGNSGASLFKYLFGGADIVQFV